MAVDEFGREILEPPPRHHHHQQQQSSYPPPGGASSSGSLYRSGSRGGGGPSLPPPLPPNPGPYPHPPHYHRHHASPPLLSQPLLAPRHGGGGSNEYRRERGGGDYRRGPPPAPPLPHSGDRSKAPLPPQPHPSKRYQDEPLLCEYLWRQEHGAGGSSANNDGAGSSTSNVADDAGDGATAIGEDNDTNENNGNGDSSAEYVSYRKSYCLRYIQSFFNQHLDHSWFRDKYSPACRRRAAMQEGVRARREARNLAHEVLGGGGSDDTGGDLWRCVALTGTMEAKVRGDLPVPSAHVLSTSEASLHVSDIPPHVTDSQIESALLRLLDEETAVPPPTDDDDNGGALLQIYSTDPSTDASPRSPVPFLHREAVVVCRTADLKEQLLARLDLQQPASSTPTPTAAPSLSVPRKEGDFFPASTSSNKLAPPSSQHHNAYALDVDCSDPYGRLEVDAGRGLAPPDGQSVPLVKATLTVRPHVPRPKVHVLTAALSSPSRISGDKDAAVVLARALDAAKRIPIGARLDDVLERLPAPGAGGSDSANIVLDVALAHLRRVHLFCFYTCTPATNVAQLLLGKSATIHVRLVSPPSAPEEEGSGDAATAADDNVADDLLVRHQDEQIRALLEACPRWIRGDEEEEEENPGEEGSRSLDAEAVVVAGVLDGTTRRQADEIEELERQAVETWLNDHAILDDDRRARCSFHFCHKLFKDAAFLRKHLMKKHAEFLKAEQAKCHDSYMMAAWERCSRRPVGDVLVNCGANFGLVPTPLLRQPEPDCVDPEPALWQREEDKRQAQEEQRKRREELRQQQREASAGAGGGGGGSAAVSRGFVDVDDMKEEKVELSFGDVPLPAAAPAKKKKKRKLL